MHDRYMRFAVHNFSALETAKFSPTEYSRLKFGCDLAAQRLGHELATEFFYAHSDKLLANRCVVISSPYNHVPNAATVMTQHFIDRLNELLVFAQGEHVEYTVIHRKVSYTNDYGFLSKEKRRGLIDNDSFYLNRDFIEGKLLLFVDDVRITGTHEDKLVEILQRDGIQNEAVFLYYANYHGNQPDIEGQLNFSGMKSLTDYVEMTKQPGHHVIIRPIKYILGQKPEALKDALPQLDDHIITKMYHGCLAEGYYKIPGYQRNFGILAAEKEKRVVKANARV